MRTLKMLIAATTLPLLFALFPANAFGQDLERAYKKEFSYLEAQKKALQARIEELGAQTDAKTRKAQAEVERLRARLVALGAESERLETLTSEVQRESSLAEERNDSLAAALEQAQTSLERIGMPFEIEDPDTVEPAQVRDLFSTAAEAMRRGAAIHHANGAFFLPDGTRVDGKIIHVGRIAAYGVSDRARGALAPAGEGRLKLWHEDAGTTARALIGGKAPDALEIFLFENLDRPIEQKREKSWLETIEAGGVIAWIIVGMGVLALLLVLARGIVLWRASSPTEQLLRTIEPLIARGEFERAVAICRDTRGAVAEVVATVLTSVELDRERLEDVVNEAILAQMPRIERFGAIILVFAAVAPLLGLLGTVTGMISTFDVITEYGTGDPKMLSGGISEALITTQLGLIVAIPALLLGNVLNGRANTLLTRVEHTSLRVLNQMELRTAPLPEPAASAEDAWTRPQLAEALP